MATQLGLYNGALRILREDRLSSAVTDNVPAKYHLDDIYIDAKAHVLEMAQWNWASVSTTIAGTSSSNRGYSYRFTKPSDFVRLISISGSSSYYPPLEQYDEDATYWFANVASIYITYVSSLSESATVTMTLASPCVVTWTNHQLVAGDPIVFATSGALPTGVTAGTTYYVLSTNITAHTFTFAASPGGTAINSSVSQSGTHTGQGLSGGNLSKWPETYSKVVEAYLASELGPLLTKSNDIVGRAEAIFEDALIKSMAKDAINRTARVVSSTTTAIYNEALRLIGRRFLTNFDDAYVARRIANPVGEPATEQSQGRPGRTPADDHHMEMILRRLLDETYDTTVAHLLSQGLWNFAQRTVAIEHETAVTPSFGYGYAFEIPTDFVRMSLVSQNGDMYPPLNDYLEEGGYFHANFSPLYVQYISNDASYGLLEASWTEPFKKALAAMLAVEIAPSARMSASAIENLKKEMLLRLKDARTKDAMDQAPRPQVPGRLVMSRNGGRSSIHDQRRE